MKDKTKGIIQGAMIIVIALGILGFIVHSINENMKEMVVECKEYETVKYRHVTSGGIFGGIHKKITEGDSYDGHMKVCKSGINFYGDPWKR